MGAWATFFEAAGVGAAETDRPARRRSVVIEKRPKAGHASRSQTSLDPGRQSETLRPIDRRPERFNRTGAASAGDVS
jgi:hypothetical protein